MTIVFDRGVPPSGVPVTHAFVLGCGRFPARPALARAATVAGARRIMEFLASHADEFVAPIWSIECLLSDPSAAPGDDRLGVELHHGPRNAVEPPPHPAEIAPPDKVVGPVTLKAVTDAGDVWLKRIGDDDRHGADQAFFYMSTHGVSDGANALGLCEDVLSNPRRRWSQSLNVSTLALGLTSPLGKAFRGWIFLDACQEIAPDLLGSPTGLPGLHLIEFGVAAATKASNSIAIAGSRMGGKAWAPTGEEAPFFTQALIEGMENACVEDVPDVGWAVTATRLIFDLPRVAEATFGRRGIESEPLTRFNQPLVGLLKVAAPMIPVAISTEVEAHLSQASVTVRRDDLGPPEHERKPGGEDMVWRFRVEAHRKRTYSAEATFSGGEASYRKASFDSLPPCQIVRLRSAM
ncbi:caspase family protein [Sphingomonas sp. CFBP 13733]|uniref:caspase family protein n=1 Tax=Sphingomonas sp. CFBP 13733 TaxID=2775291 RepID=UPI00177C32EE|nr:caspase family protein [Sphingomonas sp. CFBP 13733]MBD8640253.1 hypothetical protein [Sphingomonas sp. CFBP 13733]